MVRRSWFSAPSSSRRSFNSDISLCAASSVCSSAVIDDIEKLCRLNQCLLYLRASIRKAFADSTIVTIAHRLNTVIDFDKIVVMDKGCVAEQGSAHELLQDEHGVFTRLVESTGAASAAELRKKAQAAAAAPADSTEQTVKD